MIGLMIRIISRLQARGEEDVRRVEEDGWLCRSCHKESN